MKKIIVTLLSAVLAATSLSACTKENPSTETGTEPATNIETTAESTRSSIDPTELIAAKTYDNDHGSLLSAYPDKTVEDYEGVCAYYEASGWEIYCENELGGNFFSTYTKGDALAHVYWIESQEELNIVTSDTEAAALPPKEISSVGTGVTSVTQLQQSPSQTSGMAYIIQLSDGSFIIYDGGYTETVPQLLDELYALNGEGEAHIRAWILTHSHDDHYACFKNLTRYMNTHLKNYNMTLALDYLITAPISDKDATAMDADGLFFAKDMKDHVQVFENAKICYVHTGMTLQFSNMTLQVLHSAEDLFIDGSTGYFNDSTLVTRLYSNQPDKGETLSMIFLGDAGKDVARRMMTYYGDELRSDMCQISHHGVENFPLEAYQMIAAPTLFYPCNNSLYALGDRDADVRAALRASEMTEEILLRDNAKYTRFFDPSLNPMPIGKPNASGKLEVKP